MKQILPIILAFILAVIATLGVNQYISRKDAEFEAKFRPTKVIVYSQTVPAGTRVNSSHVASVDFPEALLPKNVVPFDEAREVMNQVLNQEVHRGDPMLWSHVGIRDGRRMLSDLIKLENRAITLSVNNVSGLEGFIAPNDRVDIYANMKVPYRKEQQVPTQDGGIVTVEVDTTKDVTFLLLQNVTVLAVGTTLNPIPEAGYNSVTLEVTSSEAGLLEFAMRSGDLALVLRNNKDFTEDPNIEIIDIESFIDIAKIKALQADRKKRIEVYRSGIQQTIER